MRRFPSPDSSSEEDIPDAPIPRQFPEPDSSSEEESTELQPSQHPSSRPRFPSPDSVSPQPPPPHATGDGDVVMREVPDVENTQGSEVGNMRRSRSMRGASTVSADIEPWQVEWGELISGFEERMKNAPPLTCAYSRFRL